MIRSIIRKPSNLTATVALYLKPHLTSALSITPCCRHLHRPLTSLFRFFSTNDSPATQRSELTRVATLVDGCDCEHWLVVMEPPDGYPQRDEIVRRYIETLAMALGSEEEAKKSIYSVSTKYYDAFSCKIPESMTHMIKSLPNVRWVLPDSHLYPGENEYGGEPFVDGKVVPYDESTTRTGYVFMMMIKIGQKLTQGKPEEKERKFKFMEMWLDFNLFKVVLIMSWSQLI